MIQLDRLTCEIDNKVLVRDLSISFLRGAIIYLKGPNGIGKTRLIETIAGLNDSFQGEISFENNNIEDLGAEYLKQIKYVGHQDCLKEELSVIDNVSFWAELTGTELAVSAALHYFSLADICDEKCKNLSRGQKKRVALARLMASPSDIWFLDEPFTNLDKDNKTQLKNLILVRAKEGGIVILTNHDEEILPGSNVLNLEDFCK